MVSPDGIIRNRDTGRILFGEIDRDGYRRVNLCRGGKSFKRRVHRLVCEAFHGPCPEGMECAHGDGNRANNRAANLRWATRSENNLDAMQHGTWRHPGKRPARRAPPAIVAEIRKRAAGGEPKAAIARSLGLSRSYVSEIASGIYGGSRD